MEYGHSGEEEFWRQEEKRILIEIIREELKSRPVFRWMHAVSFHSYSRGRNRTPRKHHREVVLIQYGKMGPWRAWSGEDRTDNGKHPWDVRAMEMLSERFLVQLEAKGIRPEDYLTEEITQLLLIFGGRF